MSDNPPVDAVRPHADKHPMSTLAIAAWIVIPFCTGMLMLWSIVRRRDRGGD